MTGKPAPARPAAVPAADEPRRRYRARAAACGVLHAPCGAQRAGRLGCPLPATARIRATASASSGKPRDQHDRPQRRVAADEGKDRQQPGSGPQAVPAWVGAGTRA